MADIVDLAREISVGQLCRVPALGVASAALKDLPILPMEQVVTPWYLRIVAEDKPGVLSAISLILSEQGISVEALIQKAPAEGETRVPVLGDLPGIGNLFKNKQRQTQKQEMLVFITPKVINDISAGR